MQLVTPGRPHLTYCTNIHPGESLADVRLALAGCTAKVGRAIHPGGPFGVGLRLSAAAARELVAPSALAAFRDLLGDHGLYVFTINGFPFGAFHGTRVKDSVYLPDWTDDERLRYTIVLAEILAALLPEGASGSISSVPGGFRPRTEKRAAEMADRLITLVAALHALFEKTGKRIELALEPEPACFLETTDDTIRFFEEHLRSDAATRRLAELTGLARGAAADTMNRHLGVCLDACHLAVEFEDARTSVARLQNAGIRIGKIQITVAPVMTLAGRTAMDAPKLAALGTFAESVYLHQTVVRSEGRMSRFLDLPDALAAAASFDGKASEWRTHFHVPVYEAALGPFTSTQPFLREVLALIRAGAVSEHLEVETYTWDVLPEKHRSRPLEEAIAAELRWVLSELGTQ